MTAGDEPVPSASGLRPVVDGPGWSREARRRRAFPPVWPGSAPTGSGRPLGGRVRPAAVRDLPGLVRVGPAAVSLIPPSDGRAPGPAAEVR